METTTATGPVTAAGNHDDAAYDGFLARIQARFVGHARSGPLFRTDATGLWDAYLATFGDPERRQYHTCNACRHFVERYGALVVIDDEGRTTPAVWDEQDAPGEYLLAVRAMARLVRRARVTGVFLTSERVWGAPRTGAWRHLAVEPPPGVPYAATTMNAGQAAAEKREDFKNVLTALADITEAQLAQAVDLLRNDQLHRSEKVLGPAEWLLKLCRARLAVPHGERRRNVGWRMVATAPAGFCHPRSSMLGTLLDDIAAGMDFGTASRRFAEKMHPLKYQRPTAAPRAGAIERAEKVVEQLGIAGSLRRRYARLDELLPVWRPGERVSPGASAPLRDGVFSHLKARADASDVPMRGVPPVVMTWDKFFRTALPDAERIEMQAPSIGPYVAFLTAADPDAPPILQWDDPLIRNPVSCYAWVGGASASQFGLTGGAFHDVVAVTLLPHQWHGGGFDHQGRGAVFVAAGARDTRMPGLCLFPEMLRSELHGVRSVIEAHSKSAHPEGHDGPQAAGIALAAGGSWGLVLRLTTAGRQTVVRLDRWD